MGLALGLGLGLNRRNGVSSFADKMWASYVSLNPGTYSAAVKTEFINRCKPTYVDSAGTGYYYNTFGPSGLNKTKADWIYFLTGNGAGSGGYAVKSGVVIRWNFGNTIISTNTPGNYNVIYVSLTSTDGWTGVTDFRILAKNYIDYCPTFNLPNVTLFNCQTNGFVGVVPNWPMPKVTACYFNSNLFTGVIPDHNVPLCVTYSPSANTGITGFAGNKVITRNMATDASNLLSVPTAGVDARLKAYNDMFAVTPPIKNLTLNFSGANMGIPTGGSSNADLLGIMATFSSAGFTATIIIRTS